MASQTNILALNAVNKAACTKEQVGGFAVIGNECRDACIVLNTHREKYSGAHR
ncbi:hypothetical protein [Pseudomonas oryzihabitans]|uniref:hypothetical protein n=1 Tax=Pseudomonas oryzihabitans TaxID=47885 RepID=UPI00346018AB